MTAKEMGKAIGQSGSLKLADFSVRVAVLDARLAFGRVDYKVQGIAGNTGEAWVDAARVKLDAQVTTESV